MLRFLGLENNQDKQVEITKKLTQIETAAYRVGTHLVSKENAAFLALMSRFEQEARLLRDEKLARNLLKGIESNEFSGIVKLHEEEKRNISP